MPTDFDWKTWKKRKEEPPPPPPEPPKTDKFLVLIANGLFYVVVLGSLGMAYLMTSDIDNSMRIINKCNEQQGIAIRTMRGDAVCIKQDVLTDVLTAKTPTKAN